MIQIKTCFVGIGSIAKRHMKNIYDIFSQTSEEIVIDVFRSGKGCTDCGEVKEYINNYYYSLEKVPSDYDVIFITNPTCCHFDTLKNMHHKSKCFFIEKPVFDNSDVNLDDIELNKDKLYYVACPLRYKKVIQYIKNNIDLKHVYSVRCISSSYLPDWRPGIDYRKTYSANKQLGGGVAIDLIHEWDYIQYLFGTPQEINYISGHISNLEIDSEDIAVYIARYDNLFLELHLDYFGRKALRELQLIMRDDTITCDLIKNEICFSKTGEKIIFEEETNDFYKRELHYFIDMVKENVENPNSIERALDTLKLAEGK